MPFNGPIITVWSDGRISPYLCKRPVSRLHQFGSKSLARYILRLCIECRVESGKETLWSQTLKNWRRWTHLNSTPRRLNAKEVLTPQRSGNFIFPVADETVTNLWERRASENTHLNPGASGTSRSTRNSSRIIQIKWYSSSNPFKTTQRGMTRKQKMTSGQSQENSFIVITLIPRVKLYVPKEETFPIPLKYIDVTRTTHTSQDVLLEKHIEDYWNVDGERKLSDAWTGFTRFILY